MAFKLKAWGQRYFLSLPTIIPQRKNLLLHGRILAKFRPQNEKRVGSVFIYP